MASSASERLSVFQRHLASGASVRALPTASATPGGLVAGQVAIITGAGQGIGAAAAILFAQEGAKVIVSDLDMKKAEAVTAQIRAAGGQAIACGGDVTDPAFPERVIAEAIKAFGKVNILVNNAGYTWDGVIHRMTDKQWYAMMDCHVTAPFRLIKALAPHFRVKSAEPRCIINVSSVSGTHGNAGQANYSSAKSAICGLTRTIAKEWGGFGVRCNAVAFGTLFMSYLLLPPNL
mmetsp:Transcript_29187/g.67673  ORF Transcript_29187/g.67673 Transcript_29187/m.67673 type:complete len:234 (-) Transcript_29187:346-1047(-)